MNPFRPASRGLLILAGTAVAGVTLYRILRGRRDPAASASAESATGSPSAVAPPDDDRAAENMTSEGDPLTGEEAISGSPEGSRPRSR